jgi:hypothetical protein
MTKAHFLNVEGLLIGSIGEESDGFRIWWRERMKNHPGNRHVMGKLYPTLEKALQKARQTAPEMQVESI